MLLKQKILFLDRDGTICFDDGAFGSEKIPYDKCIEMTRPISGVKESLILAKSKGYLLIVISNQAGIAKGRFDEWHTHYSNKLLNEKLGNIIDGFYYCPHHTSGKNNNGLVSENAKQNLIYHCDCRKPEIGMFKMCEKDLLSGKLQYIDEKIIKEKKVYEENRDLIYKKDFVVCEVDKDNSYMVGDKWIDVLAGERYGVKSVFVMSGEGEVEYNKKKEKCLNEFGELPQKFNIYNDINDFIKTLGKDTSK